MTESEAQDLYDRIIQIYLSGDSWSTKTLTDMVQESYGVFDTTVATNITQEIVSEIGDSFTKTLPAVIPSYVDLDNMLWNNSILASNDVIALLTSSSQMSDTWQEISRTLMDAYDPNLKVLDLINEFHMPEYWEDLLKTQDLADFMEKIADIQTKDYKTALNEIADTFLKQDFDLLNDALETAIKEKARYYADRIAITEITRVKNLTQATDILNDKDIKLVQWRLSSKHRIFDICDYYAQLDIGYGAGIYPKDVYPAIPLHPFCQCKVTPYYHKVKKKTIKDPTKKLFDKLTPDQQRRILGSWDKLNDYYNGKDIIDIFNSTRPKYPIMPMKDFLTMIKNPSLDKLVPPITEKKPPPIDYGVKLGFNPLYDSYFEKVRPEAKDIVNKYPTPMYIGATGSASSSSYYQPMLYKEPLDGAIGQLVLKVDSERVMLHEYGHHIDAVVDQVDGWFFPLTRSDSWDEAMGTTLEHLVDKFDGMDNILPEMRDLLYSIPDRYDYAGFSDIMDALSGGSFHTDYGMAGHGIKYFSSTSAQKAEIFANLWEAWSRPYTGAWDMMTEYYPQLTDLFLETIEEIK